MKRICIIHLNQIGDFVFSLPLLKALKENWPESKIDSVLRSHLEELLALSPYGGKALCRKRDIRSKLKLLKEIRQNRYDLVIALSNSVESLLLTLFSRARIKAGFANFPWDLGLDIKEKVEGPPGCSNNDKLLRRLNLNVRKQDYLGLMTLPPQANGRKLIESKERYVVVSPGTSPRRRMKAWEEDKFAELILWLQERCDLHPVLVGDKDSEEMNARIIDFAKEKDARRKMASIRNLTGKLGLRELCYLLKDAALFVGVDSGVMHLASSFDVRVVGIFGPTDPFYVGPQNPRSIVVREEMDCSPCYLKGCEERSCLKRLEVRKVFDACEKLLNGWG